MNTCHKILSDRRIKIKILYRSDNLVGFILLFVRLLSVQFEFQSLRKTEDENLCGELELSNQYFAASNLANSRFRIFIYALKKGDHDLKYTEISPLFPKWFEFHGNHA